MPTESIPLVTAIMPTRGRRGWAVEALRMFEAQTYPAKQIVIVDDFSDPSFEEAPPDVVYVLAPGLTIGGKRNLACSRADGQIICHWDSDDMYGPERIASQVAQLLASEADLVGYHIMPFIESDGQRRDFMYHGSPSYPIGVSLMYWRDSWAAKPFPAENIGEDSAFLAGRKCAAFDGSDGLIVARIHNGNTSEKRQYFHLTHQWRLQA
jgi:glycosyltransferase involved in cell wall biosynthesis